MKKTLLFAGMAVLMASCANQEPAEMVQNNVIGFNAFVNKATRADMTVETLDNFNVYGYYGEGNVVFDAVTVTKSGDTWVTAETAYWVADQVYNFAAVAPSSTPATFGSEKLVITDYQPSGEDDLIVAVSPSITGKSSQNEAVQLNFKHALAKVQVKLENSSEQEVSNVKISGVINSGTLNVTNTSGGELSWTQGDAKQEYSYAMGSESGVLYLIPQTIGDDVKITLTAGEEPKEFDVKQPNVGEWVSGHVYTYTIKLTPEGEKIEIGVGGIEDFDENLPEPEDLNIYVDFGTNTTLADTPDEKWNQFATITLKDEPLKYKSGKMSTAKLSTEGFTGMYQGAGSEENKSITSSLIEWPKGVWKDSFWIEGTTGSNPDPATIEISGLNPDQKFDIVILAARWNATHTARQTKFEIGSDSAEIYQGFAGNSDGFVWEEYNFEDQTHKFTNVQASGEGTIVIKVSAIDTNSRADAHISAMVISPVED